MNATTKKEIKSLSEERDSFVQVTQSIPNGLIIVQEGKISFINKICSKILSAVTRSDDLQKKTHKKSIIEKSKLLDKKIFKLFDQKEAKADKKT